MKTILACALFGGLLYASCGEFILVYKGNAHTCFVEQPTYGLNNICEKEKLFDGFISGRKPDKFINGSTNGSCFSAWWYFPHIKRLALEYSDEYAAHLLIAKKLYDSTRKPVSFSIDYFEDYQLPVIQKFKKSEMMKYGEIVSDDILANGYIGFIDKFESDFLLKDEININKFKIDTTNSLKTILDNGFDGVVESILARLPTFIPEAMRKEIIINVYQ